MVGSVLEILMNSAPIRQVRDTESKSEIRGWAFPCSCLRWGNHARCSWAPTGGYWHSYLASPDHNMHFGERDKHKEKQSPLTEGSSPKQADTEDQDRRTTSEKTRLYTLREKADYVALILPHQYKPRNSLPSFSDIHILPFDIRGLPVNSPRVRPSLKFHLSIKRREVRRGSSIP